MEWEARRPRAPSDPLDPDDEPLVVDITTLDRFRAKRRRGVVVVPSSGSEDTQAAASAPVAGSLVRDADLARLAAGAAAAEGGSTEAPGPVGPSPPGPTLHDLLVAGAAAGLTATQVLAQIPPEIGRAHV